MIIAIPVVHAAGGWIASTSAAGYLAGTLSSTWMGAFVAGNAAMLKGAGIVALTGVGSFAGGVMTGVSGLASSTMVAVGLAPATFLGLTAGGWAIVGGVAATAGVATYLGRHRLKVAIEDSLSEINTAREEGGLKPFESSKELLAEVKAFAKRLKGESDE